MTENLKKNTMFAAKDVCNRTAINKITNAQKNVFYIVFFGVIVIDYTKALYLPFCLKIVAV